MGTRTAIFQEQSNGTYEGIYVGHDGYIDGIGNVLYNAYPSYDDFTPVIQNRTPILYLGLTLEEPSKDKSRLETKTVNGFEWQIYTEFSDFQETEYYLAYRKEDIRNFDYLTYDINNQLQGYQDEEGRLIPFRGSDNNGYLYVQDLDGIWYVSELDESSNKSKNRMTMSEFKKLSEIIERKNSDINISYMF